MNIDVKHNGNSIKTHVISYSREHRICTSIGTLEITLDGTYSTDIDPWDTIDIHENGDFKVRYYVSSISRNVPENTIRLECQDKSKRLVDYFIPDTYTIDYPSYTGYWIKKFLADAGISYQMNTGSEGNLLSNYTALGLQPAYDQIMMLLQLSGWYMYFDGNGVAVIGSLDIDLSNTAGTLGLHDIIDIKRITNDDMLRNRAVVWGQFDALRQEYAYADVRTHTRWNYDHNDMRAIVISNNNIPTVDSAYGIANILIKEFSQITIEKHITATGARNYNLGNSVRVNSHIWRGKGLITTFGTSMDRGGLVTNIILDERCPRLFGFFDFGDYVYVATFGDGIWRKHIKYDPTWYNFSTGLTNPEITDLHINNGIFGAVDSSGVMYYTNSEAGSWNGLTIDSLESSVENVASGVINYATYSGIVGRATIVDKLSNTIKFGVDTASGINMGDYFMTYSSYISPNTTNSGVVTSGLRGWIVEYDPFTGQLVGDMGSGIYPIHYSGNYAMSVFDLENDGVNDYVSVKSPIGGTLIPSGAGGYNFGYHISQPSERTDDPNNLNSFSLDDFDLPGESLFGSISSAYKYSIFNNESNGDRELVLHYETGMSRITINKVLGSLSSTTITKSIGAFDPTTIILCISKVSSGIYRLFFYTIADSGTSTPTYSVYYREWNTILDTMSGDNLCGSITVTLDPVKFAAGRDTSSVKTITLNNKIYLYFNYLGYASNNTGSGDVTNFVKIWGLCIDITTVSSVFSGLLFTKNFNSAFDTTTWNINNLQAGTLSVEWLFQNDDYPAVAFFVREWNNTLSFDSTILSNYLIYSNDGISFNSYLVQTTTTSTDPNYLLAVVGVADNKGGTQLTSNRFILYARYSGNGTTYLYNGQSVYVGNGTIPEQWKSVNITPMFGRFDSYYIAKVGSDYYWCDPFSANLHAEIEFPANYTPVKIFSTSSSFNMTYYWHCTNNATSKFEILRYSTTGYLGLNIKPYQNVTFDKLTGIICGNFFIDHEHGSNELKWLYIDNQDFPNDTGTYLLLRREGTEFNLIRQASKPIRIDISNNSPVLSVLDNENTFMSSFIYGNSLEQVIPISGLTMSGVRDYRYTTLETVGGVVMSGIASSGQVIYVTDSGVYVADLATYSGGFSLFESSPSGLLERIETSNYVYPGQYIFTTTSGEDPIFYQRDNDALFFTTYTGLPNSRATIIRLDDRF